MPDPAAPQPATGPARDGRRTQSRRTRSTPLRRESRWTSPRGKQDRFPLVRAENASYGFRRNIHGLAPAGFWSCLVTLVLVASVGLLLVIVDKPVWLLGYPRPWQ